MRGAENVNGTNSVAWTNSNGTLSPWTLNSNWQHTGSTLYATWFPLVITKLKLTSTKISMATERLGLRLHHSPTPNKSATHGSPKTAAAMDTPNPMDRVNRSASHSTDSTLVITPSAVGTMRGAENVNGTNSVAWTNSKWHPFHPGL